MTTDDTYAYTQGLCCLSSIFNFDCEPTTQHTELTQQYPTVYETHNVIDTGLYRSAGYFDDNIRLLEYYKGFWGLSRGF